MAQDFGIVPVYYGLNFLPWNDPSNSWLVFNGQINSLCSSAYFDGARQYGAGKVFFNPTADVAPSDPPADWGSSDPAKGFTNADIANFLQQEIGSGRVPSPDAYDQLPIYIVILKRGLYSHDHSDAVGYHYTFSYRGINAICAWIMQGTSVDDTMKVLSHEAIEAVGARLGTPELADPCEHLSGRINGVAVEPYYSNASRTCIIPGVLDQIPWGLAGPAEPLTLSVAASIGHMDVFWVAPDGSVMGTSWDAAGWNGWRDHSAFGIAPPRSAHLGSGTAAVARTPNHRDVFWVGPDGGIGSNWWDSSPGNGWRDHPAFGIAPPGAAHVGSGIAVVARTPNHMDVFWVGPDGGIGSQWWDGSSANNWGDHRPFAIAPPGSARLGSGIAVVARTPNHMDVFWVGPDGGIGSQWWDGSPGNNWGDHRPFAIAPAGSAHLESAVAAVARTSNHLDVFWVGPDGGIGSQWWDGSPGNNWGDHRPFAIAPAGSAHLESAVAAVARTSNHLDVFWVGPDGGIGSQWWDGSPGNNWGDHLPFAIAPPGSAHFGSGIAVVARTPNHMDVFWVGPDGGIGSQWWDGSPGNNWGDHLPFPI